MISEISKVTASCSNTIAMDVCNNFHLPHHLHDHTHDSLPKFPATTTIHYSRILYLKALPNIRTCSGARPGRWTAATRSGKTSGRGESRSGVERSNAALLLHLTISKEDPERIARAAQGIE